NGGTMLDYLHDLPVATLALNALNENTGKIDLDKPSPFVSINMPPPSALRTTPQRAVTESNIVKGRLVVDTIEWHGPEAELQLLIYLSAMLPKDSVITARIERGKLVVQAPNETTFESCAKHPYLDCTATGNALMISFTADAPFASFVA